MPRQVLQVIVGVCLVLTTVMCRQAVAPLPPMPVLTLTSVSPNIGQAGTSVTIKGSGFAPGAIAMFNGIVGGFRSSSADSMTAKVPEFENTGPVDIVVRNPSGDLATLTRGFTYEAPTVPKAPRTVTLTASPTVVSPGGPLTVSWETSATESPYDWILILKVGDPSINYEKGWWQYTNGALTGTLTLAAPTAPGVYEFRYLLDDGFVEVARSSPVTVQ